MAELPSGTVTFLFTDIEGSTALAKRLRNRYGEVLEQHQLLVRSAFEAHGGREIDTQSDSFFFAFRRAKDAVAAAVGGQRALAAHPWLAGKRPSAQEVRPRAPARERLLARTHHVPAPAASRHEPARARLPD